MKDLGLVNENSFSESAVFAFKLVFSLEICLQIFPAMIVLINETRILKIGFCVYKFKYLLTE